jgi:hypothetical protein
VEEHGKPVAFYSDKHGIFRVNSKDAVQRFAVTALSRRAHPPPMGCHFYFARRVTFLSCADMTWNGTEQMR